MFNYWSKYWSFLYTRISKINAEKQTHKTKNQTHNIRSENGAFKAKADWMRDMKLD